ncbi:MAG: F0F1 ATP synthase subunit delta [bacterium]
MTMMVYLIIAQVAVFAILVIGLKRLLMGSTQLAAAKLREVETDLGRKEEAVRKRIEDNEAEFRRKSAEAQDGLNRTREAMEKDVARSRDGLLEEARKERDKIVDEANRSKEKLRQELAREAQGQAVEHARRVYELVFSEELGRKLDHSFLDELLVALDEMDSSSITISATAIEVVCSHPLEPAHRERLREIVSRKFNVSLDVNEAIDPGLIAGIKIKLGSLEIDGSLRNRFNEAIEQLKSEHV